MDQRPQFILDDQSGLYERAELCARYGISRKTGYKRLARYDAGGRGGRGSFVKRVVLSMAPCDGIASGPSDQDAF